MATPPLASAGLGSGLDVNAIIDKLMSIERRPLVALEKQHAAFESRISAYGSLKSVLGALRSAIAAFSSGKALAAVTAELSDKSVAGAAAGSGATPGTHRIEVTALAQAQTLASAGFATTGDSVGTGTLTFEFGTYSGGAFTASAGAPSKTVTIGVGQSTLAGVRDAVNAAKIGVSASIVNDGSAAGQRLVFTSASGANMSMRIAVDDADGNDIDGAGLSRLAYDPAAAAGSGRNLTEKIAAANASLTVDGIAITSASNVVTDAIAGVTLTLAKTNAGTPATLSIARDTAAVVASMDAVVKAYNEVRKTIDKLTFYDPVKRTGSVLTGDSAVRSIQSQLRSILTASVAAGEGEPASLADLGIRTGADGLLTFDTAKFSSLLSSDFAAVERLFSKSATATDALVSFASATSKTQAGTYAVSVTQLATRGTLVGSAAADLHVKGTTNTLDATIDGVTATVTLTAANYGNADALAAEVQSKLNAASAFVAAGASVSVSASGGVLTITSSRYGASSSVAVSGNAAVPLFGAAPVATAGNDVAGTIGGFAATGSVAVLTGAAGTPVEGLALTINGGATGARGTVTFADGIAGRLETLLGAFLDTDGLVEAKTEGTQASMKQLDQRKDALEARLERVEAAYRRQYTALDETIARMSAISTYLSQQLANLPKPYDEGK